MTPVAHPHIAKIEARIVERMPLVDGVGDPIGHQQFDAALVGIDAMLGQDRGLAGFKPGTGREQAGIAS